MEFNLFIYYHTIGEVVLHLPGDIAETVAEGNGDLSGSLDNF
jgi:hypothetical protein